MFAGVALIALHSTATAQDSDRIPADIQAQIKEKCVKRNPDDYMMQDGCIMVQSESYLKVHGGDKVPSLDLDLTGIPSAFDRAQINNTAYLTVAATFCRIDVGTMAGRYRERAIASDRLSTDDVLGQIEATIGEQEAKASRDGKAFCAEARKNLPNFIADLKN